MNTFQINEKYLSQIPALQLLIGLGFEFLTPAEALRERRDRTSNVLREKILRNQLKEINRIRYKGNEYLFSEESVQSAIQKLKNIKYDGLLKTNEAIYCEVDPTVKTKKGRVKRVTDQPAAEWRCPNFNSP